MPLEIDNFAELQQLRETALAQQDPNYMAGTIPIAEVAATNSVSVHNMVTAFQASGQRKIDDLSLLTPLDAGAAGGVLRKYHELQDPQLAKFRRDAFEPVTELSLQLGVELDDLLEVCVQVGFSARIAKEDLWLDGFEQDLVREWVEDSRFPSHEMPTSLPALPRSPDSGSQCQTASSRQNQDTGS
ncbi:hypothetical protein AAGW05_12215 [Arthrobacter sp. LAPM80]|uniref:hypothetical protein n=1 Tax=Arthrobacter sp. LAPM80 TaxID=3141788 RepID=UPI00398A8061